MKFRFFHLLILLIIFSCDTIEKSQVPGEKPNILWITCEDISPYLGCYGFEQAETPNIDRLAEQGIRFTHAYTNAPVCAVARSTILSGMYATTLGTHQMRSLPQLPESIPAYPLIIRDAGYYCTNNSKTDYNSNFENEKHSLWDEVSKNAHWKNRPDDKPFFSVFNIGVTHESQLSKKAVNGYIERGQIDEETRIKPEDIDLPPYHPDLPAIRKDWARFHDLITLMDEQVGQRIYELDTAGLTENTIIFFYSDHGGQLSRSKRYIYNVGTQVPLIVQLPEKWGSLSSQQPGEINTELVSFVDFPKTILSIAGCEIPELMQGRIFLGDARENEPTYVHFFRDRMGARYDFVRAVTDGEYYYIRNFQPHRPRGRDSRYGYNVQANWGNWERYYMQGNCNEIQSQFFQPKPVQELFNTIHDPWHISNITDNPEQHDRIVNMSEELDRWMIETRDIGLIPEPMFYELVGISQNYQTLFEYAQSADYPIEQILVAAKNASLSDPALKSKYQNYMKNQHPVIRYWGAYSSFVLRSTDSETILSLKEMALNDEKITNRIMAAQALGLSGEPELAFKIIMQEVEQTTKPYIFLFGINAFQYSHTDDRLTREDWTRFREQAFLEESGIDKTGIAMTHRIIDDALEIWPNRRIVD